MTMALKRQLLAVVHARELLGVVLAHLDTISSTLATDDIDQALVAAARVRVAEVRPIHPIDRS